MNSLRTPIFLILSLLLLLLGGCKKEGEVQEPEGTPLEPGTAGYYYEQGLNTSDLEEKLRLYSAGLDVVKSKKDTSYVALLEGKVYALQALGEYERSEKWVNELIKAAEIQKDTYFLAMGYYRNYRVNLKRNDLEQAFKNAFTARQLNLNMGDTAPAARRSFDMAHVQLDMGDYPGSQASAADALQYLNPQKDSIFISAAYNLIGLAYMDQGFNEDAIKEYRNALRFAARERDSLTFLHNIAIAYKNQEKYDDAIEILEELSSSKIPDSVSKSRFLDNLAYTRWLRDSTEQVDSLFFQALEMRQLVKDTFGLYTNYYHLTHYFENRNKEEALKYARESLEMAEATSVVSEVTALKKLISLTRGKEKEDYVKRYMFLHDSIDEANLKAKNYFAKIRLDEKKKQQEINTLQETNYKQALKAQRLENRNLISTFLVVFIALTAAILFYYLRQRSKREKIKGIYLTERRISKRIHDELANDMYNLMSSMEEEASPETKDKLARIYYRTRDISRENSSIDTGANYVDSLVAIISSLAGKAKIILKGERSVNWLRLEEEKKIVIYRVLQELMVNMKKHSDAQFVAITFSTEGKWLHINYKDTGKGCDGRPRNGNGLINVRNRIASVNGKIEIESEEGKGFKVNIRIPF
jgi:signal transduction histidine kinase